MNSFLKKLQQILILSLILLLGTISPAWAKIANLETNPWQTIELETEATFADVAFAEGNRHGWLVGTQAALFETNDGGDTWAQKVIDLGTEKVSFTDISFTGNEGWIVGRPSVLLHTEDGGNNWSRISLSSQLPGEPYGIVALGADTAELITNLGAIYKTTNGGRNWKALVEGSVGVARNINRSPDGKYVAVSARGNFYSTWTPGNTEWTPYNRNSSRRLQNMGFTNDDRLWTIARGGLIQFSEPSAFDKWNDMQNPEDSNNNWGFLDLGYRTPEEIWLSGGSGNLLVSADGGKTWKKDKEVDNVNSNLYRIVFINPDLGFVMGQRGILLKYSG
jgi:photosystem II stability/assembly factor-like uncharacterized protein